MFTILARVFARWKYIFHYEMEAEENLLKAALSTRNAAERRELVTKLTHEADGMDARIREVSEMEEKGFWVCENGHEIHTDCGCALPGSHAFVHVSDCVFNDFNKEECPRPGCKKPMKFIKRDQMSGQEKYESDEERGEAEKIAKQKRDEAKAEEENAANSEKTAAQHRKLAEMNRGVAQKIRRL